MRDTEQLLKAQRDCEAAGTHAIYELLEAKDAEIASLRRNLFLVVRAAGGQVAVPCAIVEDFDAKSAFLSWYEDLVGRAHVVIAHYTPSKRA